MLSAEDGESGLVVGAAALTKSERSEPLLGPGAAVHVIPTHRRRGIGRALLEKLLQAAVDRRCKALYAMQKVDVQSDEAAAWRWLGFQSCQTVQQHELPVAEIEPRLAPLVDRMRKRGWIPESARIIPLCDADREAVADLHLLALGGNKQDQMRRLRGEGAGAYQQLYSRVLLADRDGREQVVGCILARRKSRAAAVVDANIVHPDFQNGWANLWLKLEAARGARALGIESFHYSTFDHYRDTRSFTDQLQGRVVRTLALMVRRVKG